MNNKDKCPQYGGIKEKLTKGVRALKLRLNSLQHGNAELNLGIEPSKCVETIDPAPSYLGEEIGQTYEKL